MVDRAVRILFDTYWSPRGWKHDAIRATSPGDLANAKSKRVTATALAPVYPNWFIQKLADQPTAQALAIEEGT
jgi:hypothetical protein